MTRSPLQHQFSRRTLFRSGLALGAGLSLGSLVSCATPTGTPGPRTASLALNRSVVSLDNKLNQFDAAVTVQRGVRQALTRLTPDLKVGLVLAESFALIWKTTRMPNSASAFRFRKRLTLLSVSIDARM